jgi:hypothetical protein
MTKSGIRRISIAAHAEQADAWTAAAEECGMNRHEWMVAMLNVAAGYDPVTAKQYRARVAQERRIRKEASKCGAS